MPLKPCKCGWEVPAGAISVPIDKLPSHPRDLTLDSIAMNMVSIVACPRCNELHLMLLPQQETALLLRDIEIADFDRVNKALS